MLNDVHPPIAGALTVVLIVLTIFFQLTVQSGYLPLVDYLPLSVAQRIQELAYDNIPDREHTRVGEDKNEKVQSSYPPQSGKVSEDGVPLTRTSPEGDGTMPGDEHLDKNAFDHPATYEVSSSRAILYDQEGKSLTWCRDRVTIPSGSRKTGTASSAQKLRIRAMLASMSRPKVRP